jgi:hypothetical protein
MAVRPDDECTKSLDREIERNMFNLLTKLTKEDLIYLIMQLSDAKVLNKRLYKEILKMVSLSSKFDF